jgi:hypothetical protein
VRNRSLEIAGVIVESAMLHSEQNQHEQISEQSCRYTGDDEHHPEDWREGGIAIAGDVRLLGCPAAGGNAPLDKRRRNA